jgi:hypothetical protein
MFNNVQAEMKVDAASSKYLMSLGLHFDLCCCCLLLLLLLRLLLLLLITNSNKLLTC